MCTDVTTHLGTMAGTQVIMRYGRRWITVVLLTGIAKAGPSRLGQRFPWRSKNVDSGRGGGGEREKIWIVEVNKSSIMLEQYPQIK